MQRNLRFETCPRVNRKDESRGRLVKDVVEDAN